MTTTSPLPSSPTHTPLNARDTALVAMRPTIQAVQEIAENSDIPHDSSAYFLHTTLRPILKLQHDTLISICAVFMAKHRGSFLQKTLREQEDFLTTTLKKDTTLRSLVIGLCVGQFTREELDFYCHPEYLAEINKRIIELAARRVASSLEDLKERMKERLEVL
jgi:hypothetical protein